MERDILFRGKRMDNGEWIYGFVIHAQKDDSWGITNETEYFNDIDRYTVGQYTGLTDKNGVKIFEGDFIRNQDGDIGRVTWYPEHVAFMIYCVNKNEVFDMAGLDSSTVEVIGNIHDNPELLEVQRWSVLIR